MSTTTTSKPTPTIVTTPHLTLPPTHPQTTSSPLPYSHSITAPCSPFTSYSSYITSSSTSITASPSPSASVSVSTTPFPPSPSVSSPRTPGRGKILPLSIAAALRSKPIPHVVLPNPFEQFCLTSFLVTDADDLHELVNHPRIAPTLGVSHSHPFTRSDAHRRIRSALDRPNGWPLNALRRTNSLQYDQFPPLVGTLTLSRDSFTALPASKAAILVAADGDKHDEDAHWTLSFVIDPAYAGKGIMTAALRYVLSKWYVPVIDPEPGQLTTTWPEVSGAACRRVYDSLGFMAVAKCPRTDDPSDARSDLVCAVWQGAGVCSLDDSVFKGLDRCPARRSASYRRTRRQTSGWNAAEDDRDREGVNEDNDSDDESDDDDFSSVSSVTID